MGDRQPPQPQSAGADLRRPQASPAPGVGPPPTSGGSSIANPAAMPASQYALAAAQYQQAALALAASGQGGANPMAMQHAQAQILAQYQQFAMNPEMLLKQYPHLAGNLAGPPHLLGRPNADHHMLLQAQREREMAAERERQQR